MANITADKETVYRADIDEYAVVSIQRVTRIVDDEGSAYERTWRRAITPDDAIDEYPQPLQDLVTAARYPAAVARFEARKLEG